MKQPAGAGAQITIGWTHAERSAYQRLGHDDAYLALREGGEVGEEALEDELARLALGVDVDGHHGDGTLPLPYGTVDRREWGLQSHRRGWDGGGGGDGT